MDGLTRAGMELVGAIVGRGGSMASLPCLPTPLFHVEHSPNSRTRHSDPHGSMVVDMEATNTAGMFHVEHSQDSPLHLPTGYSGDTTNKGEQMNINEAMTTLVNAITEQVLAGIESTIESAVENAISDHNSDFDHDDFVTDSQVRDIVEDLISGATISL